MAKKEQANLSIEEKLQTAIVPEWEQPYRVPQNWEWTRLNFVAQYKKGPFGSSITKAMFVPKSNDTYKVYEQGNAIQRDRSYGSYYITKEKFEELKSFEVKEKDIIVSCAGTIGETFEIPNNFEKGIINQALMRIRIFDSINREFYLFYFDDAIQGDIKTKAKGTAIKNIPPFSVLKQLPFPLPPVAEQQRIVDRINSLFSKLNEAKEKAQVALDSFTTRKSAVLHQAFTGELTKKWREENSVAMDSWENVELQSICKVNPPTVNTKKLPDDLEVSFIPMAAVSDIFGEVIDPQIRPLKEVRTGYTNFVENDVVLAKITPCMENGKAAIIGKLVNNIGYGTTEFYVLRCSERLNNKYLYHIVRNQSFRDEAKAVMTGAVGQQRVPKLFVEEYEINLPKIQEQIEIVRILDSLFKKEQKAKELYDVIDKIDLMKKAILARAFRGELGTNDPDDESAIELLKECLLENDDVNNKSPKAKNKSISIPLEIDKQLKSSLEREIYLLLLRKSTAEIKEIMALNRNTFDVIEALKRLEEKKLVFKHKDGSYSMG